MTDLLHKFLYLSYESGLLNYLLTQKVVHHTLRLKECVHFQAFPMRKRHLISKTLPATKLNYTCAFTNLLVYVNLFSHSFYN